MWNLKCMAGSGRCDFKTNDLVAMQEHAMNEHNASRSDVREVNRTTIEDGKHYEFRSRNGRVHFDSQKDERFCPECGGLYFSGSSLIYEHSNFLCSMRWDGEKWIPDLNPTPKP